MKNLDRGFGCHRLRLIYTKNPCWRIKGLEWDVLSAGSGRGIGRRKRGEDERQQSATGNICTLWLAVSKRIWCWRTSRHYIWIGIGLLTATWNWEPGEFATNIRRGNAICEKDGAIGKGNNIGVCSNSGLLDYAGPFSISISCVQTRFHAAMSLLVQRAVSIDVNIMPACVAVCTVEHLLLCLSCCRLDATTGVHSHLGNKYNKQRLILPQTVCLCWWRSFS